MVLHLSYKCGFCEEILCDQEGKKKKEEAATAWSSNFFISLLVLVFLL